MHQKLSSALRILSAHMPSQAKSGHPGLPLGMADVITVLCKDFLRFYPQDPTWFNRDRFILSAGHGSSLLYSMLYLLGYNYSIEDLQQFRQLYSKTPGHPEWNINLGIETTTGPLGQGLANAVGIAINEKKLQQSLKNHAGFHTIVLVSDGDLMEGMSHESLSLASHLNCHKLIILHDNNHISIDGSTNLTQSFDEVDRLKSYGFHTQKIDGHNPNAIHEALAVAYTSNQPSFISCETIIGWGSIDEGTAKVHGNPLSEHHLKALDSALGYENFNWSISEDILQVWRTFYQRNEKDYQHSKSYEYLYKDTQEQLNALYIKKDWMPFTSDSLSTRIASQHVMQAFVDHHPKAQALLFGSADLQGSTGLHIKSVESFTKDHVGSFIHFGIREHAMGGIMNGMALDHTLRPVGSTFFVFSDYMRPSMRMAALMKLPVIYVFSHDSIGVGEDGPTHQPIEQLTSIRHIPNMLVIRPADQYETFAAWNFILQYKLGPTALILTRQKVPNIYTQHTLNDLLKNFHKGAISIKKYEDPQYTFIASGSEVSLALQASDILKNHNIFVNVVSMPSINLFLQQSKDYQDSLLGKSKRWFIEAGLGISYEILMHKDSAFIGLHTFGKSGTKEDVFAFFQLTVQHIVQKVLSQT